jgi:hypothetical protein
MVGLLLKSHPSFERTFSSFDTLIRGSLLPDIIQSNKSSTSRLQTLVCNFTCRWRIFVMALWGKSPAAIKVVASTSQW